MPIPTASILLKIYLKMARRDFIDDVIIDWVKDTDEGVQTDYFVGFKEAKHKKNPELLESTTEEKRTNDALGFDWYEVRERILNEYEVPLDQSKIRQIVVKDDMDSFHNTEIAYSGRNSVTKVDNEILFKNNVSKNESNKTLKNFNKCK